MGVMIESHLKEGRQDLSPGQELAYGQSITDACIGWEETVLLLEELAQAVRMRADQNGSEGLRDDKISFNTRKHQ